MTPDGVGPGSGRGQSSASARTGGGSAAAERRPSPGGRSQRDPDAADATARRQRVDRPRRRRDHVDADVVRVGIGRYEEEAGVVRGHPVHGADHHLAVAESDLDVTPGIPRGELARLLVGGVAGEVPDEEERLQLQPAGSGWTARSRAARRRCGTGSARDRSRRCSPSRAARRDTERPPSCDSCPSELLSGHGAESPRNRPCQASRLG